MTEAGQTERYSTVTPYLLVDGVEKLVTFLEKAFAAEEILRLNRPDGTVMHVEVRLGDSIIMMGEPLGEFGSMPSSIYLKVEDCDAVYQKATEVGGISVMEPMDMVHAGQRYGGVKDPTGNLWWIATTIEDVSPEEQSRRIDELEEKKEGAWSELD